MSKAAKAWLIDFSILILLTSLLYGLFLGLRPLTPPDEGRYSEIPREMVVTKDYLTPRLDGVQYFEKPILFYWLQASSIKLFGLKEWSLRLVNALMGAMGALLTYAAARRLYGRRVGLLSGMLLSTSLLYAFLSRFITLDITMTFFLTGSLFLFILGNFYPPGRKRQFSLYGMYIFAALATLTKGLIGIFFPGMVIVAWLLMTKQWRQLLTYHLLTGTLLFLIITAPWHIWVGLKNPGFFNFYFYEQHFLRYLTDYANRNQSVWFLPMVLLVGWFPWTGFMLVAIKKHLHIFKNPAQYPTEVFLFLWPSLIFLFYWLSHSQLSPYLLPIFPPLAIITARYLNDVWNQKSKTLGILFGIVALLNISIAIAILVYFTKNHNIIPLAFKIMLATFSLLSALLCNIVYQRYDFKKAVITLFVTNMMFSLCAYYTSSFYNHSSAKNLALELKKVIQPNDIIFNYNHYFQDFPVYLERPVTLLNWKGELEFGSKHNAPAGKFLHENYLWDSWLSSERKFVLMTNKDFEAIRSTLKTYQFYPIARTPKYVLICNKNISTRP